MKLLAASLQVRTRISGWLAPLESLGLFHALAGRIKGMARVLGPLAASMFFAVSAFLFLRFPQEIKNLKERTALFEFQRRTLKTFDVGFYRLAGWISVICSALMLLLAIAEWIDPMTMADP